MADIVLINPRFEVSYWGLEHALPFFGKRANLPVAALPLLAALTPPEHTVALVDENVEAIRLFEHRVPGHARPRRSASGHLELLIELPEPGRLRGSTLARVLRVVAHGGITVNPYRVTRDAIRRLRGDY